MSEQGDGFLRAVDVYVSQSFIRDVRTGIGAYVIELNLILEGGKTFKMVNIPADVAEAIRVYNNEAPYPSRQSLFAFLLNNEYFREMLTNTMKDVRIDHLDQNTGLYTATVNFQEEGVSLAVKMIPSHAVYLALIAGKPIYVREDLVDEQEYEEEEEGYEEE